MIPSLYLARGHCPIATPHEAIREIHERDRHELLRNFAALREILHLPFTVADNGADVLEAVRKREVWATAACSKLQQLRERLRRYEPPQPIEALDANL